MKASDPGLVVADIMLGLSGILFLVLAVVLVRPPDTAMPKGQVWLAAPEGLILGQGQRIGLDALAAGQVPRPSDDVPILLVEPGGLEAAFLAESAAARAGWRSIEIRRLSRSCPRSDVTRMVEGLACLR